MTMRGVCFTAICIGIAGIAGVGCSSGGTPEPGGEVIEVGTASFPLETFGPSGMRYRLHNAIFEIRDKRTARVKAVLNSDDEPFSSVTSAELDAGDYQVMLQPGWFIEQINDGSSFPGPIGPSTDFPTPTPSFPVTPSTPTFTTQPIDSLPDFDDETFGEEVTTVDFTGGFTGGTGSTGGGFGRVINAALESNAIQDFTIFPNQGSFIFYTFRVGDNVISFEPGSINIIFEVIEDGVVPPNDPCDDIVGMKRPSVIETSLDAMQFLTLRSAFDAMAINDGFGTDGETIYKQIIDSYASAGEARMPDAVHCGDETTDGVPTLNGYPIDCDRAERFQFDNLDLWQATAFVNRFDLAPESGAHCGQQRMVFSSNAQNRMFFILEAQIPNPQPDLGLEGCAPLAEFWAQQVEIEDPISRGVRLFNAFLNGDPDLQAQGFGPFVRASNYTVGTGQIRTNNFDDGIWTLREFKLATDSGEVKGIPFPVAEAPHGPLWNDNVSLPNGELCREAFLESLQGVLVDEPSAMTFVVPQECKDAESRNSFEQDYGSQLAQGSGLLIDQIDAIANNFGLSAFDIANRASFSGSCIGCHNEQVGRELGNGVTAPFSLDFVHVNEFTETCPDGNTCFQTSNGLKNTFLPHRLDVLSRVARVGMPPSCGEDGPIGADGGVIFTSEPPIATTNTPPESDLVTIEPGAVDAGVVFVEVAELPAADTPVEQLVRQDEEIRKHFGRRTIGGQDARVSH